MPITYVGGWVIVQGDYSGSTNIFELIYNASVGGAWGIHSQNRNGMQLAPVNGIQFGQAAQASPTLYNSQNENVIVTTAIKWGLGNATFPTTGIIGVYDAVRDLSTDGSKIEYTTPGAPTQVLDADSTLNVYDSELKDNQPAGLNWQAYDGLVEKIDTKLWVGSGWLYTVAGSNFDRVKATTNFFGIMSSAGQTWNDIRTNFCMNGISVLSDGTIQNTQIINAWNFTVATFDALGAGTFFDFINCDLDFTDFVYYNLHTRVYRRRFTIDIATKTKVGTAVPGVRVRAWDTTQDPLVDPPLFDVVTGGGGSIGQQLITVETNTWGPPPGIYTSLNPITFFINKVGWKEVRLVSPVTVPCDLAVEMTEIEKEDMAE